MLKIRKSYSLGKLRNNILKITNGDKEFYEAAGQPWDMFFHIYDNIVAGTKQRTFYNVYVNNQPIAYLCISKQTKEIFFYVSIPFRKREVLTDMFAFVRRKIGNEFYTGTKKTNTRFVEFAKKNGWCVFMEDEKNVIFKGLCQ